MPGSREERGLVFVTIRTVRVRVWTLQIRSRCFEEIAPLCRVSEVRERHFKSDEDIKGKSQRRILNGQ